MEELYEPKNTAYPCYYRKNKVWLAAVSLKKTNLSIYSSVMKSQLLVGEVQ